MLVRCCCSACCRAQPLLWVPEEGDPDPPVGSSCIHSLRDWAVHVGMRPVEQQGGGCGGEKRTEDAMQLMAEMSAGATADVSTHEVRARGSSVPISGGQVSIRHGMTS